MDDAGVLDPDVEARLRAVLAEMRQLSLTFERLEHEAARLIVALGVTWEELGEAHDPPISRQSAQKRYSHPKPRRPGGAGG